MSFKRPTKFFFIFIVVMVTCFFLKVLSPYFSAILWSVILAVIFNPVNNRLRNIGLCNGLAALVTLFIICLIVFIPLAIILLLLAGELNILYTKLIHNNAQFLKTTSISSLNLPDWLNCFLTEHSINNIIQIKEKVSHIIFNIGQYLASSALLIAKEIFRFFISFIIMLYILFFLLKEGSLIINQVLESLPLSYYLKQRLFAKFVDVARATVKSMLLISLVQGILGGLAFFYIAKIENSVLYGTLIAFLSLIPIVGSSIIWIPVAIYLFFTQKVLQGSLIVGFFLIIVSLVDNILRPLLVGKDTKVPDYIVLLATLGGIGVYGINGIISGPLIAALFITCWNILSKQDYIRNINKPN